jgi:hypothetical protein
LRISYREDREDVGRDAENPGAELDLTARPRAAFRVDEHPIGGAELSPVSIGPGGGAVRLE